MAGRAYLHAGPPKTGTTYLQTVLWNNIDRLRYLGSSLAADEYADHGLAVRELVGLRSGKKASGAWERYAARARAWSGPVIMSQEHLSNASTDNVERAVRSLAPHEVTLIVAARDMARLLASSWQHTIKSHSTLTLSEMVHNVRTHAPESDRFWLRQDVLALIDRWLPHIPADRIVVITVPPPGAEPEVLWNRFAAACNLDATGFDLTVTTPNESLGAVQAEVLRRLNLVLAESLERPYSTMVRTLVANKILATQTAYAPFRVDEESHAWALGHSRGVAAGLVERGVRVIGSLDDVIPGPWVSSVDPVDSDEGSVATAAVRALADLLLRWQESNRKVPGATEGSLHGGGAHRRPARTDQPTADESYGD